MKKIIAFLLISALLLGSIPVAAAPLRDGYTLVPEMSGITGVDVLSDFILTTPPGAPVPAITIDGQPPPAVIHESANRFRISPSAYLSHNSLYIFRLARDGEAALTWAFQTTTRFEITSNFPRNEAVNVPVDTVIDIAFSSGEHEGASERFSIKPHVEGRFEYHGGRVIFLPLSPLEHQRLYTVTLKAGVGLPGTNEVISGDHVFSFETAPAPDRTRPAAPETVRFWSVYSELPSFEPPSVNFRVSYNARQAARPVVNINVYRFESREQAVSAVEQLAGVPRWTMHAWRESLVDTSGLTNIMSFEIAERQGNHGHEILTLPENLPHGFYLINAGLGDFNDQMILQITDLAVQVVSNESLALVWAHDMTTGRPAAGARVYHNGSEYITDGNGIAETSGLPKPDFSWLYVTDAEGNECIVFFPGNFIGHWWQSPWAVSEDYFTALQLDRTLFQRGDTLHFWGFAQNRRQDENIENVTAVITQGHFFGRHLGTRDTLHRQTVPVWHGAYSGEINLPNLDPGSYVLTIFHGDISLGTFFFSVQDFVKPPYQLHVSADRRAVFAGEEVMFTVTAEFFEGTPVSELELNYNLWGHQLQIDRQGSGETNIDGVFEVNSGRSVPEADAQGQTGLWFNAQATLPEIGWVSRDASVSVFINDIDVDARAVRTGENANISLNVHNITLDRLNDGTAEHGADFLGEPVAGQRVEFEISRVYWVPVRIGEFYDPIERRVVPRYRHDRREEVIDRFELVTDENGEAGKDFLVPDRKRESYQAALRTTDGNGRVISRTVFIGRDFSQFFFNASENQLFLDGARDWFEGYDIGDEVNLSINRGTEQVTQGNFLFVIVQDEILHYFVGDNPVSFTFDERHLPNVAVYAFHFNGHTYHSGWQMRQELRFNSESRRMVITAEACGESYRPGDVSTITIRTADGEGRPKPANINISVVDEALFALRDYRPDTLSSLYGSVSAFLRFSMSTHRTFESDGILEIAEEGLAFEADAAMAVPAPAAAREAQAAGEETHLREDFEDTAAFASLRTNERGEAVFSFRLPDNITSWRLTVSGISDDLYAGNTTENIIVTNPMFLHYSLNDIFLVGDMPVIGVNVYGTSLAGGERVEFEIWDENTPSAVIRASGSSFERVNIPLWEMTEEGRHAIIIRAAAGGFSDAVRHSYQVVSSHRQVYTSVFHDVTTETAFNTNAGGLTNITFTDRGRGQFLRELMLMRHVRGARIEGLVMRREASRLIERHFPDIQLFDSGRDSFNPRDYQLPDGGIAIFPYAESDLSVTVRLMPFIIDDINVHALRQYLYGVFEGDSDNKMRALYGLAQLREPVLLDLQNYAMLQGLPVRDMAYIALGFAALGELETAAELFNERITPHLQRAAPFYRVYTGLGTDSILEATSAAALLAAKLGMPQREGLHGYVIRNHTSDLLVNIERLSFIVHEIENRNPAPAAITYSLFGQEVTRDLSHGRSFTLRIPVQNMHEFNLLSVTGDVGAVSLHRTPLEEISIVENDIAVSRRFLRDGRPADTFEQGDLVRVEIRISYPQSAIGGSYQVTDFLPAGLVPVSGSLRFEGERGSSWRHAAIEGQRIMFFDHNLRTAGERVYYYYARVVSPGTFRAEGTVVQSTGARDYLTVGGDGRITIS